MWTILQGDARRIPLGDETVQCVVTSPPFWGLRDYGLPPSVWGGEEHEHEWGEQGVKGGGSHIHGAGSQQNGQGQMEQHEAISAASTGQFCPCGAWLGVLGLEPTPELYIEHMVEIFREVRRVLRKDGTVWMNLGDSYASTGRSDRKESPGVGATQVMKKPGRDIRWKAGGGSNFSWSLPGGQKPKDLIGIPWRVALALQADGWWLRSDIIWDKANPMPESVTDRPTRAHEYVFLLTKSSKYFYDNEAVKEDSTKNIHGRGTKVNTPSENAGIGHQGWQRSMTRDTEIMETGRNLRSVWHIATQPFPEAHFATFPQALVEPCIKAGTSEKGCCAECGSPWERVVEKQKRDKPYEYTPIGIPGESDGKGRRPGAMGNGLESTTLGWQPTCKCWPRLQIELGDTSSLINPCLVLDPFAGSGTVGVVCLKLGRSFVGVELKPDYCEMANKRVFNSGSLLDA